MSTSFSYHITLRLEIDDKPGMFGRLASVIGACECSLGAIDLVSVADGHKVRDVALGCRNEAHAQSVMDAIRTLPGVRLIRWVDRVFQLHLGGKIEVVGKTQIRSRDMLSMVYTPQVARVCEAIVKDPAKAFELTIKRNTVAIVTDGTAVLGLGDIGPAAGLPVMEGKAMLFKEFGGVNAFPICLDTKDTEEIIRTVKALAPGFGGINLEDISAPRCFEIEERLKAELDIPVFHDDQHGTSIVVLAALKNALKVIGKNMRELHVVISGAGAAGLACARMLRRAGVRRIIGVDRAGIIHRQRKENMNPVKMWFATHANPEGLQGGLAEACRGADLFLGVSGPGVLRPEHIRAMGRDPIIFALANPTPEIMPEEAEADARIIATGRSDYPNQINNVLCFPGLFRGCLMVGARTINDPMKWAAVEAIATSIKKSDLAEDHIIPSVFDKGVAEAVAQAVAHAAIKTGVARRMNFKADEPL